MVGGTDDVGEQHRRKYGVRLRKRRFDTEEGSRLPDDGRVPQRERLRRQGMEDGSLDELGRRIGLAVEPVVGQPLRRHDQDREPKGW